MWIEIVLFLLLGVCAVSDGIKKEIPLVPVWAGILFAVLLHVAGAGSFPRALSAAAERRALDEILADQSDDRGKGWLRGRVDSGNDRAFYGTAAVLSDPAGRADGGIDSGIDPAGGAEDID